MKKYFIIFIILLNAISCSRQKKITVSAIGDIMVHDNLQNYALSSDDGYNIFFKDTKKFFLSDDLTIANLETTVDDGFPISGYPRFNAKTKLLDAIKAAGIDILSTANNHAIDNGYRGVLSTIGALKERNMIFSGSGLIPLEAKTPAMITVKDIRIAFFSTTASFNDPAPPEIKDKPFVNYAPAENEKKLSEYCAIIKGSKANTDIVIVSYHAGNEYESEPSPGQRHAMREMAEAGADVVLGHHPHVIQPIEFYNTKDNRRALIAYSLGNFISAQARKIPGLSAGNQWIFDDRVTKTAEGMILLFDIIKADDKSVIKYPRIIPVFNIRFTEIKNKHYYNGFDVMAMSDIMNIDEKDGKFENIASIKKLISYRIDVLKKEGFTILMSK